MNKTPTPPPASEDDYGAFDAVAEFSTPTGPKIEILDPIAWQDRAIPERRWLVADMIPMQNVMMLSGDGGGWEIHRRPSTLGRLCARATMAR